MRNYNEVFSNCLFTENYTPLLEPVKAVNMAPTDRLGTYQTHYQQGTIVGYTISSKIIIHGSQRGRFGIRRVKRVVITKTIKY